jgi:hypothetical protein
MSGIVLIGLVLAVLLLSSRLSETRYQLDQARTERDVYAHIYEDMMCADTRRSGTHVPPNCCEMPEEWWRK